MTDATRPLEVARADLLRRTHEAADRGDWQEHAVLTHLATVADMVCRIADHPDSTHYRAEKAGPLLDAAVRVQGECLTAHLLGADEHAAGRLERATEVLAQVADAVLPAMWAIAGAEHGVELDADDIRQLRLAAAAFATWADGVASPMRSGPGLEDRRPDERARRLRM